ncbi:MAG: Na+/H+ antiporter subunit C [Synoicihabitans sp.]
MSLIMSIMIGVVFATGVYCLLRRSLMRLVVGIVLLGQAANLAVFTAGGLTVGSPALVPEGGKKLMAGAADPLPQALVLTAIVIGFGLTVFAVTLLHRARETTGNDDVDAFNQTDEV